MADISLKKTRKKDNLEKKEGEVNMHDYSEDEVDKEKRSNSISEIMRIQTVEESKNLSELERKNIKKNLIYKEFENFPEDEEEFD